MAKKSTAAGGTHNGRDGKPPPWMSTADACRSAGISMRNLQTHLASGRIESRKVGRIREVRRQSLEAFKTDPAHLRGKRAARGRGK